jgi:hypothetical protein
MPTSLIPIDLIILIMFNEEYKLWRPLCNYLYPPVTSFLFGSTVLFSTLFSYTLDLCSPLRRRD